jgi:hypothetical protein
LKCHEPPLHLRLFTAAFVTCYQIQLKGVVHVFSKIATHEAAAFPHCQCARFCDAVWRRRLLRLSTGALLHLDATVAPRVAVELPTWASEGYTCATIPNAGTVVLVWVRQA